MSVAGIQDVQDQMKSNQNSLFKQNTKISAYTVIIKLNKSKTPFIILAQIIVWKEVKWSEWLILSSLPFYRVYIE